MTRLMDAHGRQGRARAGLLPFLLALILAAAAACGGEETAPTDVGEAEAQTAEEAAEEDAQPDPSMPAVEIVSLDSVFEPTELEAPADEPFQIVYENQDQYEHNVSVYPLNDTGLGLMAHPIYLGEIFAGPKTVVYEVPELKAGRYLFQCDVHGRMEGYLTAV